MMVRAIRAASAFIIRKCEGAYTINVPAFAKRVDHALDLRHRTCMGYAGAVWKMGVVRGRQTPGSCDKVIRPDVGSLTFNWSTS